MDYIIIGGGPTGLSLAYYLVKLNYKVTLIEKDNLLGGSWNSYWIDNKYFSENSPRVLGGFSYSSNMKFFKDIGMKDEDFYPIYGNFIESNLKISKFISESFTIKDYFIFGAAFLKYGFSKNKMVMSEWMDSVSLSKFAKNSIRIISITICDLPENTNVTNFFGSLSMTNLKQMKEPDKWVNLLEEYFSSKNNISIFKNMKVTELVSEKDKITEVHCYDNYHHKKKILKANKIVICTQSNNIYPILKNSNQLIRNNWFPESKMKKWSEETFYSGFGFQLHFDFDVKFPKTWCWSCMSEWTIIILPVSDWLTTKSKDTSIKTVWSCCIIDMDTKSKNINKTANECSKDEVIDECMYQLNLLYKIPTPKVITISPGINKKNGKWESLNTGFTRNKMDYLPIKGKLDNLFALGCFTYSKNYVIANMETATDATLHFLDLYETNKIKKIDYFSLTFFFIILVIIIIKIKF